MSSEGIAPVVSIVIVTYNALEYVQRCLQDIRTRTKEIPYEVVVVDNRSQEPTREFLQQQEDIRLVLNDENKLWCAGCNDGIRAADPGSKYILLLNSDIEIRREDWLQVLIAVMEQDPRTGIVGPQHNRMRGCAPVFGWIDGHCMLIRRKLLDEVGLLDCERWPWSGAPAELTAAAYARGYTYRVVHPDDEPVHHHENKSTDTVVNQRIKKLPKPKFVFPDILRRYGIQPRRSVADLGLMFGADSTLGGAILRWFDQKQFYYAHPVGKAVSDSLHS